jgi:hypothetical protein
MNAIADALQNAPAGQDDYLAYLQDVLGCVQEIENPSEVFPYVFRFFEDHVGADLGTPGPLVHFIERFYPQYLEELCASVARRPTTYTVWMLNTILNAKLPEPTRQRLVGLLRTVANNPSEDQDVRQEAQRFLERQQDH